MFLKIAALLTVLSLGASKSVGSEDVVWFPNPNGDGSLIPARLTPPENSPMELGDPKDIHFLYYHKGMADVEQPQELFAGNPSSIDSFNPNLPLKVLVHGFGGNYTHTFPWELRGEYVKVEAEDYNLILINWSILSDSPDYFTAVANAFLTSTEATTLLKYLVDEGKATWENIHLIGFSLGGQLVGQIGHKIQQVTGGTKVARITALDPALPLFDVADPVNRTSPEDATFVDVMHTAANGILGYFDPLGHLDFYPNGGRYQPGCGVDLTGSCGHGRAPAYFIESVFGNTKFIGTACEDYEQYQAGACTTNDKLEMGHHTADPGMMKGMYFLDTNAEPPFAKP